MIRLALATFCFFVVGGIASAQMPTAAGAAASDSSTGVLSGSHPGVWPGEQVREAWVEPGIRVLVNAPLNLSPSLPTRLVIFATPNGNTAEQTLGSALVDGPDGKTDWHFDIQHIAAQIRRLREVSPGENVVVAVVEAEGLSWPAWRQKHTDNAARIQSLVESLRAEMPGTSVRVDLTGHSGGGSFLFGFLNAAETIPDWVERIGFLDANYAYNDTDKHGDKLLAWLKKDPAHHLSVIAYDDREIMLDGKKVVGPDGGTFRASQRMIARFTFDAPLTEAHEGDFIVRIGSNGQIAFHLHRNPKNVILHTVLVGEMNGLLEVLTENSPLATGWGTFGGPRAYTRLIQPAAGIPARPPDAIGGAAFMASIAALSPAAREEAIAREICRGNIPGFLRTFVSITLQGTDGQGKTHTAVCSVMPDYLAIGSDADWVRVPMTPMTAQRIADAFGCILTTRKMADEIYNQAAVKLEPHPLTEAREAVATFLQHHQIIEEQRTASGKPLGALVAGIKKDVVVTNRLGEKPHRVAIYGWHKPDGNPIQPLTIVHKDTYVDYSHGIRLVKRTVTADGTRRDLHLLLHHPDLSFLFSDEGPLRYPSY